LDTETRQVDFGVCQRHYFRLGWGCYVELRSTRKKDTEQWKEFLKPRKFCRWIETLTRTKRPLWIFSHNLFFDLQVMLFFEYFTAAGWELDFLYENGLSYIIVIRKDDLVIKGISTTNYFDTSLKSIGELIGLPKLGVDFGTVSQEELSVYCRRDVEILKLAMEWYVGFLREHNLGKFGMTKSSQALNAYRHRFMNRKIYVHSVPEVIGLEKDCYMGGRVECFRLGEIGGGLKISLDVNSMYPFVMRRYLYPSRFIAYHEHYPLKDLRGHLDKFCAVAEVLVDTPEPCFALRQRDKIIFPTGRFRCYLCSRGLHLALEKGWLKGIIAISFYDAADLFSGYVDYFYGLKRKYDEEKNQIYRKLVKYFLNCLYGKFAQQRPIMDYFHEENGLLAYRATWQDETTGEAGVEYKLMNRVVREYGKEPVRNSLIAVSAHITEDARLTLDEIISRVGRDRVLYCDTDSVKIFKRDLDRVEDLIDPHKLGALKIEEEFSHLNIIGPKSYLTDRETVLKGIPKSAVKITPVRFRYTSFPKQVSHLRSRNISYFETRTIEKNLKLVYDKGIVHPDGRVTPFCLAEF